jgi:hypothetical protein
VPVPFGVELPAGETAAGIAWVAPTYYLRMSDLLPLKKEARPWRKARL